MSAPRPTRRQVAAGLAWSIPAVTAAAAAPAMALSPAAPAIQRYFQVTYGANAAGPTLKPPVTACDPGAGRLSVTTNNSDYYYRIVNVRPNSTVTNVTASVLVDKTVVDAMKTTFTWTSATKDWSNPIREVDAKGIPVLYTDSGLQYYRYFSNLLTAVPAAVNGTITFPRIQWYSTCHSALYDRNRTTAGIIGNGRGTAAVNGVVLTNVGAFRKLLPS